MLEIDQQMGGWIKSEIRGLGRFYIKVDKLYNCKDCEALGLIKKQMSSKWSVRWGLLDKVEIPLRGINTWSQSSDLSIWVPNFRCPYMSMR